MKTLLRKIKNVIQSHTASVRPTRCCNCVRWEPPRFSENSKAYQILMTNEMPLETEADYQAMVAARSKISCEPLWTIK